MEIQKVRRLKLHDKVGLTAPAGPVCKEKLIQAVSVLENIGFQVKIGDTCYLNSRGYLAGSPKMRAKELNGMFANKEISAIFCLRGGYGSPQILPLLDEQLIKNNPKLFIGYSDITALHIFLQQVCNLPTVHGPMPATDLIEADTFTAISLLRILSNPSSLGEIQNPPGEQMECLLPGKAEGCLIGGNLTLVSSLMGTPYEIDTRGKILFLEEINEEPYKLDRMITQLALAGKFSDVKGIVLGSWTNCQAPTKQSFHLRDLMKELLLPYRKPVLFNLRAGHCQPMVSLLLGAYVELDATAGTLTVTDRVF